MEFKDFLIMPRPSKFASRREVDLTVELTCPHSQQKHTCVPIVVANMYNCGTLQMANILNKYGCSVALHKFYQQEHLNNLVEAGCFDVNWFTLGLREEDQVKFADLPKKPKLICLDVANGYIEKFVELVKRIREEAPDSIIMAGNVCTEEGTVNLIKAGASIVKVGIGSGGLCRTRQVTGVGVPQAIAVENCSKVARDNGAYVCSDGGIREIGDFAKAFCMGASLVMAGGIFMGYEENEGDWTYTQSSWSDKNTNNLRKNRLKVYGMSSVDAMQVHYGGKEDYRASEGISDVIDYKGPVEPLVQEILGGLASACTYVDRHLRDMKDTDIIYV